jgi:glycosyltransferase involved in cell wall biosynthesis
MTRALIVIPTYNEIATLQRCVMGVLAADRRASVLIVDDGSPDGTGGLADELAASIARVNVHHREGKLGLGTAYRRGFTWGLAHGFDAVCEMDADMSHPAESLPALIDALDTADVAIGSRYVPGGSVVGWPLSRQLLSRGGNAYVRGWTGVPVRDATAGFRAYRRGVIQELDMATLVTDGYAFQLEMTLRAWQAGFRIAEVPIRFLERQEGASKMSKAIVGEAMLMVARWGWQIRTGAGRDQEPTAVTEVAA